MEKQRTDIPGKRKRVAQALLIGAALFALIPSRGLWIRRTLSSNGRTPENSSRKSAWRSGGPRTRWC